MNNFQTTDFDKLRIIMQRDPTIINMPQSHASLKAQNEKENHKNSIVP